MEVKSEEVGYRGRESQERRKKEEVKVRVKKQARILQVYER